MKTVLTGVKPTGTPHLGNFVGAIRPALELSARTDRQSFLFIADYHALTTQPEPENLRQSSYSVAASFLALGLDPERTVLYRQSDVPEIFEITWILSCFTAKGLMNRGHAYKAKIAQNEEQGKADQDAGINMGLFSYPVLMSADILSFDANEVPVGEDQIQHLEIARDLAEKVNHFYQADVFRVPDAVVKKNSEVVGIDGRKMSKSYDNTLPIFMESKKLRKRIMKITTDSAPPEAPKSTEGSLIFDFYKHFASEQEVSALATRYATGIGWGEAKQALFEVIDRTFEEPRERYEALMAETSKIDKILRQGAEKARSRASVVLSRVKKAVGTTAN